MAFLAVMVMYIVSTMGYGVHRCATDGTASLILLFGESPCEYAGHHTRECCGSHDHDCDHSHEHECEGEHNHGEEHNGCCSTDVYVLTHDQNTIEDNINMMPQENLMAALLQDMLALGVTALLQSGRDLDLLRSLHPKEGGQAVLCTFRI